MDAKLLPLQVTGDLRSDDNIVLDNLTDGETSNLEVVGIEADALSGGTSTRTARDGHLLLEGNTVIQRHTLSLFNNTFHSDSCWGGWMQKGKMRRVETLLGLERRRGGSKKPLIYGVGAGP